MRAFLAALRLSRGLGAMLERVQKLANFSRCRLLALVLLAFLGASCIDGVPVDKVPAVVCKCEAGKPCPVDVCDLQVEISQKSCTGKVAKVEVLLGGQLEPAIVQIGSPRRTCATIERGKVLPLHARSDTSWQWIEDIACPPAGPSDSQGVTVVRVLNCTTGP